MQILKSRTAIAEQIERYNLDQESEVISDTSKVADLLDQYDVEVDVVGLLAGYTIPIRNGDSNSPKVFEAYEPKEEIKESKERSKGIKKSKPASVEHHEVKKVSPVESEPAKSKKRVKKVVKKPTVHKIVHSVKDEETKRKAKILKVTKAIKPSHPPSTDDGMEKVAKGMDAGTFDSGLN